MPCRSSRRCAAPWSSSGVLVERNDEGKARAVATDGRRLILSEWFEDDPKDYPPIEGFSSEHRNGFSAILPTGALKAAAKGIKNSRYKPILGNVAIDEQSANGKVLLSTTDLETVQQSTVATCEGHFPKWQDVVPDYKTIKAASRTRRNGLPRDSFPSIRIGVNAKLLAELLTTICKINKDADGGNVVSLEVPLSPDRPMVIHSEAPEFGKTTAVIMPVNLS